MARERPRAVVAIETGDGRPPDVRPRSRWP
jgi:hypothetical protein